MKSLTTNISFYSALIRVICGISFAVSGYYLPLICFACSLSLRWQIVATDPDARISVTPDKATKLNYMSQLCVDTGQHVIMDIQAYHAEKKDNQDLQNIVGRLEPRLNQD